MDELAYTSLQNYYHALEKSGYLSMTHVRKLLVLLFYLDLVYDYRGLLDKSFYRLIETALDCLYGSTCLIPYPDYLKMGKLHLGAYTELAHRVKHLEDTEVIMPMHDMDSSGSSSSDTSTDTGSTDGNILEYTSDVTIHTL